MLQDLLSSDERSKLIKAVRKGYLISNQLAQQTEFLSWNLGMRHLPYLKNIAVDYSIAKMIEDGHFGDFKYRIQPNKKKTSYHLEVENDDIVFTISQVANKLKVPRNARFRSSLSSVNQTLSLFEEDDKLDISNQKKIYCLMTHGYKSNEPLFINFGIPLRDIVGWLEVDNLLALPRMVEKTDDVIILENEVAKMIEFKTEIEKFGVKK